MEIFGKLDILKDVKIPKVQYFSDAEYTTRLQKVREKMSDQRIDLLILTKPENIRYLTGFYTFGGAPQFLLIPQEGEPVHILRFLESFLTEMYSYLPSDNVIIYDDTEDPLDVVARLVKRMGLDKSVIGTEGWHMSDLTKHRLSHPEHGRLCHAAWRHIDGNSVDSIVESVRDVKSEAELDCMRRAGRMSVQGAKAGLDAIREGVTDNEVAAEIAASLFKSGSEMLPHSPIVTSGWRSGVPHTSFERQRIQRGDTVLIEFTGVYAGYVAPIMRSAVVGQPNPKVKEMSDVLMEALHAALDRIKPGVTAGEVDEACRTVIEKAGYYMNFRKRTGYSVGLSWPEHISLKKDDPTVLKEGMTFHLPVALRDYGKAAVGFSVTVAVTEGGIEVLTELPTGIFVVE